MTDKPLSDPALRNGSPAPGDLERSAAGPVDRKEARKGTAGAKPVLVMTPDGAITGVRLDGAGAHVKDMRSPAEIEAEIDRTREHLAATLDELSDRLTPRNMARSGGRVVKAQFVDVETGKVRVGRVAVAAGGAAAMLAALMALRSLRSRNH
ncbi:MAG TPA: DUF3618 domain-containing protein [Actinocrinis sp.]|jgi:hypothetical protein|uniref:DUF3618 domain-containing protein n=1 Tax=Actinocrinis sp. TaxID=1920516 RepID=UPI002DDD894E|nr:DUF3618 domain-containing protein [Actinocrinis sp.]HEV3169847.1 DUF3618 domain-containing protein [Actinocrinis sp.]